MRLPHVRFRLATLLSIVAVAAVVLAATRARGKTGAAIALITASVYGLARKRYAEVSTARILGSPATGAASRARPVVASALMAAAVIGLSDLALLIGYYGWLWWGELSPRSSHWSPHDDPVYRWTGFVIGVALALWVASSLRRGIWTTPGQPRQWRSLRPLIVVGLIGLACVWSQWHERWSICTMLAESHATDAARAKTPSRAAEHRRLQGWYARAAVRPWLPIHPDEGGSE
ncbi:MAG: hypothetical protein ACYC61_23140 [Isosphaeraceae bacterium]